MSFSTVLINVERMIYMHGRKPAREPKSDKGVDVVIHTPHDQVVIIDVGDLVGETQGIALCGGYRLESKLNATRRGLPPPTSTLRFWIPAVKSPIRENVAYMWDGVLILTVSVTLPYVRASR